MAVLGVRFLPRYSTSSSSLPAMGGERHVGAFAWETLRRMRGMFVCREHRRHGRYGRRERAHRRKLLCTQHVAAPVAERRRHR
jgi:hypothetical protein